MQDRYRLPPELLCIVKEHIPAADLRTHVCYYNTCRMFASFYGTAEEQEEFWKNSCELSGICLLGDESWKEVAFECIAKDGFCSHPFCGGALLDWNAEQVASAVGRVPKWSPEETLNAKALGIDREELSDEVLEWGSVVPHKVFEYVGFSAPASPQAEDPDKDAFLRYPKGHAVERSALYDHPIARRSTAVFPSFSRILYYGVGLDDSQVETEGGAEAPVTVWDVQNIIREELEGDISYEGLIDLVRDNYPFLLDEEGNLKSLPVEPKDDMSRDSEDGETERTFREIWSRCQMKMRTGLAHIGDLGDVTVNLNPGLYERKIEVE